MSSPTNKVKWEDLNIGHLFDMTIYFAGEVLRHPCVKVTHNSFLNLVTEKYVQDVIVIEDIYESRVQYSLKSTS